MSAQQLDAVMNFEGREPQSSYSALTLHRKCPQAWLYRYGMGLERAKDTPTPFLTIGRWWSVLRAAEALTRGRAADSLVFVPRDLRDKDEGYDFDVAEVEHTDVIHDAERRWKSMTSDEREEFESALGASLPDRLDSMYALWSAENEQRFEREHPLGVEVFWKRELPRPKNDEAWNLLADPEAVPRMSLIGYIDELYYDRERKMTVILDSKAPKDLGNTTSALDDLMDSQLMLYAWGIAQKLKREGIAAPRAIAFDRTRSVAPKEPQLTATGTLSKSVTLYDEQTYRRWARQDTRPTAEEIDALISAAEEAEKPYTAEQIATMRGLEPGRIWGKVGEFYASGAKKGLPKFGVYELDPKELERLASPLEKARWTDRSLDPVNRKMIEAHLRSAVDTALDIFQTQTRAKVTGQAPRNLDRRGCAWCDYADLCRAQIVGGPDGEYDLEAYGLRQKTRKKERTA